MEFSEYRNEVAARCASGVPFCIGQILRCLPTPGCHTRNVLDMKITHFRQPHGSHFHRSTCIIFVECFCLFASVTFSTCVPHAVPKSSHTFADNAKSFRHQAVAAALATNWRKKTAQVSSHTKFPNRPTVIPIFNSFSPHTQSHR